MKTNKQVRSSARSLLSITENEWITFRWIEITCVGDSERMFLQAGHRTPSEMAEEIKNLDLIKKYKEEQNETD
jgi:hypothetical protein